MCTLNEAEAVHIVQNSIGLQIFCDGGYVQGKGAAAFVVAAIHANGESVETKIVGARGLYMTTACSAFHAEVTALDIATEFVIQLARRA